MSTPVCEQDHEHGAKCMMGADPSATIMGATTWAEVDDMHAAHEAAEAANEAAGEFQSLVTSILYADGLGAEEKAARIVAAASELPARMKREIAGKRSIVDRILGRNKAVDKDGLGADAYAVVPDPETPSTWKLRIDDAAHISGAIQAMSPAGFRGQRAELDDGERAEAIRKIGAAIRRLPEADRGNLPERLDALKSLSAEAGPSSIAIWRDAAGTPARFTMWASNNFRDREGEIFPAAVIEAAVERFNARPSAKGYANVYHVGHPGLGYTDRGMTDWGEIEHAAYTDGFLLLEGRVTDTKAADGIDRWKDAEPIGTSIEYRYIEDDLKDSVYSSFDFDRASALPRRVAANPWSPDIAVRGERSMPFNEDVRSALVRIYDEDQVKTWEAQATAKADELRAAGVSRKEIKFEAPAPTITFLLDAKTDEAAAPAAESSAPETAVTVAADEPPAWAKALADQNAAILARIDQSDAAIKAVKDELDSAAPAVGIFGRSVQSAGLKEAATAEASAQDQVMEAYRRTGQIPDPSMVGEMADWGVAGKVAAAINGSSSGANSRPAGA